MEISVLREDIELSIRRYYRECVFSDKKFSDLKYIGLDNILFEVNISEEKFIDIMCDNNGEIILQYEIDVSESGSLILNCVYDVSEYSEIELGYNLEGYSSMSYGRERV